MHPPDPGRTPLPKLAFRFAKSDMKLRARRMQLRLGLIKLHDAVPDDWKIPDSALATKATELCKSLCPEFIYQHTVRSYCFGAILAARNDLKLDRETFYVASALHDLGLSEAHKDDAGSFEWVGARLAHGFCAEQNAPADKSELVYQAIALHTSAGIAESCQAEIAMLHFGTGMDLFGFRMNEITRDDMEKILTDHPRDNFCAEFGPCLQHQADTKPDSNIAGAMRLGLRGMILESLC